MLAQYALFEFVRTARLVGSGLLELAGLVPDGELGDEALAAGAESVRDTPRLTAAIDEMLADLDRRERLHRLLRGSTAILFEGHELGHVHPDRGTLDMPLSDDRRAEVLNEARAKDWFSGWVSKPLTNNADTLDGIALLRESYDELRDRGGISPP